MPDTTQQLKADINAGKTGDKITEGFDPGLATLGTDDEAAGSPATPQEVALARRLETRDAAAPPPGQGAMPGTSRRPVLWMVLGALVILLAALAVAVWAGRA